MKSYVSIKIGCECGTETEVEPPKEIQQLEESLRYFTLKCPYCGIEVGNFSFSLNKDFIQDE